MENLKDINKQGQRILEYLIEMYSNGKADLYSDKIKEQMARENVVLPENGIEAEELFSNLFQVLDSSFCNVISPSYFGYITPRPLPITIMGNWLAAVGNQTPGAWRAGPMATYIENLVIGWIADFIGYDYEKKELPPGIITTGGSTANLSALHVAREECKRRYELQDYSLQTYYLGIDTHMSIVKSLNLLGIDQKRIRIVGENEKHRMDCKELEACIKADISKGYKPTAIIGTYGTTTVGAIDEINRLREIADIFGCWFHLDAASGGVYAGQAFFKNKYGNISVADSVTVDPSKWLFTGYGTGCLLMKASQKLFDVYHIDASYWEMKEEQDNFQMSFNGTRAWSSLGVYCSFMYYGRSGYSQLINKQLYITNYLEECLKKLDMQILRESQLPIIVFRPRDCSEEELERICQELIEKNIAYTTIATIHSKKYLRIAVSNYLTEKEDINKMIQYFQNL